LIAGVPSRYSRYIAGFAGSHDDFHVARTSADVAAQRMGDFVVGSRWIFGEQMGEQHDKTGRAIPALRGDMFIESQLYRGELAILGDRFDCFDVCTLAVGCQRDARKPRLAIDEHSACPTIPYVAAMF
jgi:hypothetical protein